MVLFGVSAAERSRQTGTASERTLYRRTERFEAEGMESLFFSEAAKQRALPRWIRRTIAELKGEHPPLNPNEISNIVYVRTGRRVLSEEPIPIRIVRRFEPYHAVSEPRERRRAVVVLHAEGWTVKAIAGYLKVNRDTVYQTLRRWVEEGEEELEDRSQGRPKGIGKVNLRDERGEEAPGELRPRGVPGTRRAQADRHATLRKQTYSGGLRLFGSECRLPYPYPARGGA